LEEGCADLGRDQLIAELTSPRHPARGGGSLQWGRDQLIAEFESLEAA
jgi:hypothetical protein